MNEEQKQHSADLPSGHDAARAGLQYKTDPTYPAQVAPVSAEEESLSDGKEKSGDGRSYWKLVRRQYRKNRPAVIGLWIIIFFVFLALFADFLANNKPIFCQYKGTFYAPVVHDYLVGIGISSWSPELADADWKSLEYDWSLWPPVPYQSSDLDPNSSHSFLPPFSGGDHSHYLGTDQLGRDLLSGLIHGARISLSIGIIAMGIATLIGLIMGSLAGFFGGKVDFLISRLIEIFLNFPTFFLIITIIAFYQDKSPELLIFLIMFVIGITGWMGIARLARGEVLRVRNMEYVTAAGALGFSAGRVITRHVLPNSLAPVLVAVAFGIASAILTEAALSFLGFGVPPTIVTWGSMLSEARGNVYAWWLAVFPGFMIFLTVLCYNLIGDGLRDATDPRLKL